MTKLTTEERLQRSRALGILVDSEDEWLLSAFTWSIARSGHVYTAFQTVPFHVQIHHYIIGLPILADYVVDHIDQNPLNNRRTNIHYVTRSENRLNSYSKDDPLRNIEQFPGGNFRVRILRNNVWHDAPRVYRTLEDAQQARDDLLRRIKHGYE